MSLRIEPDTIDLLTSQEQVFRANSSGLADPAVDWSISGGSIVASDATSMRYRAPSDAGSYTVWASSRADPAYQASAAVRVAAASQPTGGGGGAPLVLWITPSQVELPVGGRATFVLGVSTNETPGVDTSVTWSATGGTLEIGNVVTYVAAEVGRQQVIAQSTAYPGIAASASVIVH